MKCQSIRRCPFYASLVISLFFLLTPAPSTAVKCPNSRNASLSSFVRHFHLRAFLPDDYLRLYREVKANNGSIYGQIRTLQQTLDRVDRLLVYGEKLQDSEDIGDTIKYLISLFTKNLYESALTTQCMGDLWKLISAIREREMWAWKWKTVPKSKSNNRLPYFIDSFGSVHLPGLLQLQLSSYGEFDQCLSIKSPILKSSGYRIYGKYCQLQIESPFPPLSAYKPAFETELRSSQLFHLVERFLAHLQLDNYLTDDLKIVQFIGQLDQSFKRAHLQYGVCFPASCSTADIAWIFNQVFYPMTKLAIKVDPELCEVHPEIKETRLDVFQLTALAFFGTLSLLVLFATIYELYLWNYPNADCESECSSSVNNQQQQQQQRKIPLRQISIISTTSELEPIYTERLVPMQLFLSFGALRNSAMLGHIDNRYAALDTARFLLTYVLSTINALFFAIVVTPQMLKGITASVPYEILYQNSYWFARVPGIWCDAFVFTIGVTIVLQQFNILKHTQGKFNYFLFLIKPWIRVSVLLLGTTMAIYLFPLTGSGPLWHINESQFAAPCKASDTLASSFLMYSNLLGPLSNYTAGFACNPTTWFISMSAQLYACTPLLFLTLYFCPGFGLGLTFALLLLNPLFVLSPAFFSSIPPYIETTKMASLTAFYRSLVWYHFSPLQYVSAMVAGLLTGYLIKRKPNLELPGGRKVAIGLWCLSSLAVVGVIAWNCSFWGINLVVSSRQVLAWFVLSKYVCLVWLAYTGYLCCTGRSVLLTNVFTIHWLQPIAKLSYSIYLLRSITIFRRFTRPKETYKMEYWETFEHLTVDFGITIVGAYLLYLLLEAPCTRIARILASVAYTQRCYRRETMRKRNFDINQNNVDFSINSVNGKVQSEESSSNGKEKTVIH